MHLLLRQCFGLLVYSFISSVNAAGQLSAKLNLQLELQSSCKINNQSVDDGTNALNFGQLDFGDVGASFNHVLQTSLSNGSTSGLTIQCPENLPIKITFGAGLHDHLVPASFSANYFHAVSNGTDFLAYNLLYGSNFEVLRPNQSVILNNNGQLQTLSLAGRTVNNGQPVSLGQYVDTIPITIEF
jgi:spore coat protein U-like protein